MTAWAATPQSADPAADQPTETHPHKKHGKPAHEHEAPHTAAAHPDAHKAAEPAAHPAEATEVKAPPRPPRKPVEPAEPPMKLPAFAALKFDEIVLRRGPGDRYPKDWIYNRRNLPVEIERTYDIWRYIRDPDGVHGWVMQVQLTERRYAIIMDKDATLRASASDSAAAVALLKPGVIARLRRCDKDAAWCQVEAPGGYKGYVRRDQVWGLLPDEEVAPS